MYTLQLSSIPLTPAEKSVFSCHLLELGLDDNIWVIYEKFLKVRSAFSRPLIVRVKKDDETFACMFIIECKDYGPTLSRLKIVEYMARKLSIPVFLWMKAGIAAEICANPVFINKNAGSDNEIVKILDLLRKSFLLLIIHDLSGNASLHPASVVMPYPDEGIIDITGYVTINDYQALHHNLKKKLNNYQKIGGRVDIVKGKLDDQIVMKIKECVISTSERSVFKLPYQDDYPDMCAGSATIDNRNIIHFLCRSDEEFYGYHSFIVFKNQIRCLNGAFNRNLATTHHSYENMIYRVVEYAIVNKIQTVYFGPTLNETKKRMMNRFIQTQLYFSSNMPLLLKLFTPVLKRSRLNAREMLEFSGICMKTIKLKNPVALTHLNGK
jgi:hypothetical protein